MKGRKAILMPETLKIIIAVACIVLLLYLLVSMYGLFTKKSQIEQAKATLSEIVGKANSLRDGETAKVLVLSPKGWYIILFNENDIKPQKCSPKGCLCLCPDDDAEGCNNGGNCQFGAYTFSLAEPIELEKQKAFNLVITRQGNIAALTVE